MIDLPFDFQMNVWKCALTGDLLEFGAAVAENQETSDQRRCWDRTKRYIDSVTSTRLGYKVDTPYWWALPWVAEHQMWKEMA